MEFLKPHITTRNEQLSNIQPIQSPIDDDNTNSSEIYGNSQHDEAGDESSLASSGTESSKKMTLWNKTKPQQKRTPTASVFKEYVDYKKAKVDKHSDHLTKYFQSLEETIRTFPPKLQIEMKCKFSKILHEAEMQAIDMQSASVSNEPTYYPNYSQTFLPPTSPLSNSGQLQNFPNSLSQNLHTRCSQTLLSPTSLLQKSKQDHNVTNTVFQKLPSGTYQILQSSPNQHSGYSQSFTSPTPALQPQNDPIHIEYNNYPSSNLQHAASSFSQVPCSNSEVHQSPSPLSHNLE